MPLATRRRMFGLLVNVIHETRCWRETVNFVSFIETEKKKEEKWAVLFASSAPWLNTNYEWYIQRNRLHPKSRKMSQEINNEATGSTNRQRQHEKLKPFYSAHTIYKNISPAPWSAVHRPCLLFHVDASNVTSCEFTVPERNKSPLIRFVVVISYVSHSFICLSSPKIRLHKMRFERKCGPAPRQAAPIKWTTFYSQTQLHTSLSELQLQRNTVSFLSLSRATGFRRSQGYNVLALDVYDAKTNESRDRFED